MTDLFLKIVNMSITASILVLLVLVLRLVFQKAPKWVNVLLWGLVAIRLVCPFAVESSLSLMPKTDWVRQETYYHEEDLYFASVPPDRIAVDTTLWNDIYKDVTFYYSPIEPQIQVHRGVSTAFILNCIWLAGVAAMLIYMLVSYILVMRRIRGAKQFRDTIYTSESVTSPFVFGLIRPRIYLPEHMDAVSMSYVIAHEESHLRRLDHLWKPFGFLLLSVHWFNPLIWLAYILLCRDMEMACDERVIRGMNSNERVDYSEALLDCSISRKKIAACPLAFGEVGVKERIKTVLRYKKPAFWIVVLAVIASVAAAVGFLTNPLTIRNPWVQEYIVGAEGILGQVDKEKYESVSEDFAIGADQYGRAVFKDPFKAFDTMKELYSAGLELIAEEQDLSSISHRNYNLYKKFGWQVTSGSEQAKEQARFVSGFLDIYENSFDKEKPNTDLPAPTTEDSAETGYPTGEIQQPQIMLNGQIYFYCATGFDEPLPDGFDYVGSIASIDNINGPKKDFQGARVDLKQEIYADKNNTDIVYLKYKNGYAKFEVGVKKQYLTLADVIALSQKGNDLTWEDFDNFRYIETGSGLYIRVYEIDETFSLWIGGGSPVGTPMYIYLNLKDDLDTRIDIRDGGVEAFIEKHTLGSPLLYDRPIDYYIDIAYDNAKFLAETEGVTISKERYNLRHNHDGSNIWIQFYGLTPEGWDDRFVDVALVRNETGDYAVAEDSIVIKSNTEQKDRIILVVIGNCFEHMEDTIRANPSKKNKDSILAMDSYSQMMNYGDTLVLQYIFAEFLKGGQTNLHGFVLWQVMTNLMNENEGISYDALNGQDYFDHWLASARSIQKQHDTVWLAENVPAIALVLSMAGEDDNTAVFPITITEIPRDHVLEHENNLYIHEQSEYTRYLLINTTDKFTNVRFTSMTLTENGLEPDQMHYIFPELTQENPLMIGVVFYGDMTTYGLFLTDVNGVEYSYILSESGIDSSVVLQEYRP